MQAPPRSGAYRVIYADPPWHTATWSGKGRDRCPDGPRGHYATMPLDALKALPVGSWAAREAALLLWAIDSHLPQALELGAAWGFHYSTVGLVWHKMTRTGKPFFGGGHATRKGAELCLLFRRGKLGRRSAAVRQVITAPVREHSRKPDETYERIERLLPGPYLELFARTRRAGWDVAGDQPDRFAPIARPPAPQPDLLLGDQDRP